MNDIVAEPKILDDEIMTEVYRLEAEFDRARLAGQNDRDREKRNWEMYAGLDLGQYETEDRSQAAIEKRKPATFNLTTQKVDSLHGYTMKNLPDVDYVSVDPDTGEMTRRLKDAWLSDKEMMDWENSDSECVRGGMVYCTVQEMFIDYSAHPLGNINFRTHLPGYITFDPRWKTSSAKDCSVAWSVSYMSASQILAIWPELAQTVPILQNSREFTAQNGEQYEEPDNTGPAPMHAVDNIQPGISLFRVVRKFEMVTEDVEVEYDKMTGMDLPIGTDYAKKVAWLNTINPRWEPSMIKKCPQKKRVCMVTVFCSQLISDKPIERKPCEVQVERIPFFPLSADRINGVWRSIVDLLYDINQKLNYREELITNLIESTALGAEFFDPMFFGENDDLINDYIKNSNVPGSKIRTAPGMLQRDLMPRQLQRAAFPTDIRDQALRMWDYADRISKAPAVFDARSEKSGESGYLFAQKARVAEQQSYGVFFRIRQWLNEKAEAYLLQAKVQYSIGGVPRFFKLKDAGFWANEKSENGAILNDFSMLPRCRVVISESPAAATNRMITRAVSTELLRVTPPEFIGTRQVFNSSLVESLDTFNPKQRKSLEKFTELEETLAEETLKNKILQLKAQNKQIEMQMTAPPPPAPGAPGAPGMPPVQPGTPAVGAEQSAMPAMSDTGAGPENPEANIGYQGGRMSPMPPAQ